MGYKVTLLYLKLFWLLKKALGLKTVKTKDVQGGFR